MIQRQLMTPDELKTLPKGSFILAKTGCRPMRTKLPLFLKWGISFEKTFETEESAAGGVAYADRNELEQAILRQDSGSEDDELPEPPDATPGGSVLTQAPEPAEVHREIESKPPLQTD